jgi:hypothetical protein
MDSVHDIAPFTITKSIEIDCSGTSASILAININTAGVVVTLRNLSINSAGGNGIQFQNGAALVVENCVIRNQFLYGIWFVPTAPGAKLTVTDSLIAENGNGSTGAGIVINPQGSGTAQVALNRVTLAQNVFGIAADSTGNTGGINVTISDSVSAGNVQDGIIAVTQGGAPIAMMVKNTKSVNNNIGIRSFGTNVTIRVSNSVITGNGTGLNFSSGGALLSFGNNEVQANGANGAFSGSLGLQ